MADGNEEPEEPRGRHKATVDKTEEEKSPLEKLGLEYIELHNECLRGSLAGVKACIEGGADLNKKDSAGRTALMIAAHNGEELICRTLLDNGAEIKENGEDIASKELGLTTLHFATGHTRFHVNIMRELINCGADVNKKDGSGFTPLMKAVMSSNEKIVKLLLDSGADKTPSVTKGLVEDYTAYDFVGHIAYDKRQIIGKMIEPDAYTPSYGRVPKPPSRVAVPGSPLPIHGAA